MVKSVVITTKTHQPIPLSQDIKNGKLKLDIPALETKIPRSFDLVITFQSAIKSFRNHDYTWVSVNQDRIAGEWVPKIIQLENGFFVQPNLNRGYWEIYKAKPNVLFWRFNPEFSNPW